MRRRKRKSIAAWSIAVAGLTWFLFGPVLWLEFEFTDSDAIRSVKHIRTAVGEPFELRYVHSVEKTPVSEYFTLNETGAVVLTGTRFHGFGAGLPTDGAEGTFSRDGDAFVISDWERLIGQLRVRLSPMNEYTLIHGHRTYDWPEASVGARLAVRGFRAGRLTVWLSALVERGR